MVLVLFYSFPQLESFGRSWNIALQSLGVWKERGFSASASVRKRERYGDSTPMIFNICPKWHKWRRMSDFVISKYKPYLYFPINFRVHALIYYCPASSFFVFFDPIPHHRAHKRGFPPPSIDNSTNAQVACSDKRKPSVSSFLTCSHHSFAWIRLSSFISLGVKPVWVCGRGRKASTRTAPVVSRVRKFARWLAWSKNRKIVKE